MGLRLCCSGGIWSDRPRRFSPPCRSGASRTGRADDPRSFRSGRVRLLSGRKRPECGADAIACGLVTRKTSSLGRDWPGRGSTRPAASAGGAGRLRHCLAALRPVARQKRKPGCGSCQSPRCARLSYGALVQRWQQPDHRQRFGSQAGACRDFRRAKDLESHILEPLIDQGWLARMQGADSDIGCAMRQFHQIRRDRKIDGAAGMQPCERSREIGQRAYKSFACGDPDPIRQAA